MTRSRNLLSVRLESALAAALDEYCAHSGETRSHVVQQGLAQYLVEHAGPTLSSLAEALLPELPANSPRAQSRQGRQRRYRDYVREKRRR